MGLGWHVALERSLEGVEPAAVDGKALIFFQRQLDELAGRLNLESLTTFVSVHGASVADYLRREGLDPDTFPIPEEEWFDATDGLATVRGLIGHLRAEPGAVTGADKVVRDLRAIEGILAAAERAGVRFHLESSLPELGASGDS